MKMVLTKKFTDSVKLTDGTTKFFTTGLEVEIEVDSADKLISESDKLFAQVRWLTQRDQDAVFNTGA